MEGFAQFFVFLGIVMFIVRMSRVAAQKAQSQTRKAPRQTSQKTASRTESGTRTLGYGSLPDDSQEGEDPCHEDQFHQPAVPMGMHNQPYLGSLGVDTGEGEDPCHEEQLQPVLPFTQKEEAGEQQISGLSWTGNDIVRGFIVSEVLNRKNRFSRVG